MVASIVIIIIMFQLLFHHVRFKPWLEENHFWNYSSVIVYTRLSDLIFWKRIIFTIIRAMLFTTAYQI